MDIVKLKQNVSKRKYPWTKHFTSAIGHKMENVGDCLVRVCGNNNFNKVLDKAEAEELFDIIQQKDIDSDFEYIVATVYRNKRKNAQDRGIDFNISLGTVRNLLKAKRCYYTGVELEKRHTADPIPFNRITIDRIDSNLGYIKGNVVACCYGINNVKAVFENQNFDYSHMKKFAKKVIEKF